MAIAHDTSTERSSAWVTGVSSMLWNHTCTGSDRILFVVVGVYTLGSAVLASGVTYNSVALTKLADIPASYETNEQELSIWYLVAPATGSNQIAVTLGGTADFVGGFASSYTGVNQSTPLGTPNEAQNGSASTSSPSCAVSVTYSNSWLIGAGYTRGPTLTAGSGTTVRQQSEGVGVADSNGAPGTGSRGLAYTSDSAVWPGVIVAELIDASPAGGDTVPRPLADISVTGWTSTGASIAAVIDETTADDADYATSPAITGTGQKAIVSLTNGPLSAGNWAPKVRAAVTAGTATMRVSLLNDSNASQGSADVTVTTTITTYSPTITTSGSATRLAIEFIS